MNKDTDMKIMTPKHDKWNEFYDRLVGPEGCNFTQDDPHDIGTLKWKCYHNHDFSISILKTIPNVDVDKSIEYFKSNGGYCDCEVLFNVF